MDATRHGTRRRGALDRDGPASSVPEPGAGSRGTRTPTATAPRQAGPAGPPATGISVGLTTVTPAWVTGRVPVHRPGGAGVDRSRWLAGLPRARGVAGARRAARRRPHADPVPHRLESWFALPAQPGAAAPPPYKMAILTWG